jgi:hypothetical protein
MKTVFKVLASLGGGLLIVAAMLVGSPVDAQVVLNGDPTQTEVTVNSTGCQCEDATTPLPTDITQTLCTLNMSIPVSVVGPGRATFSYSLFGNALEDQHDGVNAWISLSPPPAGQSAYIATAALSPFGVAPIVYYGGVPYSGGSWIGNSQTVDFTGPASFTVLLNIAFNRDNRGSAVRELQEWGCPASKVPSPSYLKIQVDSLPSAAAAGSN